MNLEYALSVLPLLDYVIMSPTLDTFQSLQVIPKNWVSPNCFNATIVLTLINSYSKICEEFIFLFITLRQLCVFGIFQGVTSRQRPSNGGPPLLSDNVWTQCWNPLSESDVWIGCLNRMSESDVWIRCLNRIGVMHTVEAIHCSIRRSSAENHGSGVVSERTSGQLPMICPNSLALPPRIGHTESLVTWWNWQHSVFWNRKFHTAIGGKWTIHTIHIMTGSSVTLCAHHSYSHSRSKPSISLLYTQALSESDFWIRCLNPMRVKQQNGTSTENQTRNPMILNWVPYPPNHHPIR